MAKRANRLPPIDHERRALEKLKTIEPNATPEDLQPLSDALVDVALAALDEVHRLESGDPFEAKRLQLLYALVMDTLRKSGALEDE